ncbi:hypothetical protein EXIGLDRAFT_479724 [Exidia glandulosa HHB12029]|uniref:Uncharacterized protein n=1 Tax=Exidia glandulosa HHB12029 TaxID=1314781 RepID=A0A165JRU5_EXIGL|nr:hypothetical protein EXIGLDRAFT_479724 [Exidia glandulosa HHB12029]
MSSAIWTDAAVMSFFIRFYEWVLYTVLQPPAGPASGLHSRDAEIAIIIKSMLHPRFDPRIPLTKSFWATLTEGRELYPDSWSIDWIDFGESLARVLFMGRGLYYDESDIAGFFAGLSLRDVIGEPDPDRWYLNRRFHLLQHCISLNPEWWVEGVMNLEHGSDDAMISVVRQLERMLVNRGPRCSCAGRPLRQVQDLHVETSTEIPL